MKTGLINWQIWTTLWIHGFLTHYILMIEDAPILAIIVYILITFKLVYLFIIIRNKRIIQ